MHNATLVMTFEESVRKRPGMYIGNDGMVGLFNELLIDIIDICKTDVLTFEITILTDKDFLLGITAGQDLSQLWQHFTSEKIASECYMPKVLYVLSSAFQIQKMNDSKTEISFTIEETRIVTPSIDYFKLNEKIMQLAMLNRNCEIVTIDKRQKITNQQYFYFPQGVFYLFNSTIKEALGEPAFILTVDTKEHSRHYQIGIAYRTDWYPSPNIISYANDINTVSGGSLVDGVLEGILSACRKYVKDNTLTDYKVTKKKLANGLILVGAVRGQDFKYGGSWKETLEDDTVKKEVKKIVSELALNFFRTQKEKADTFLWRFDTTKLANGIY